MTQTKNSFDVVVIGAGISGLRAADLAQAEGLSVAVLEARERVGGKTLTNDRVDDTRIRQEYGAAWINDTTQDRVWSLVQELGLTAIRQHTGGNVTSQGLDGKCHVYEHGGSPKFDNAEDEEAVRIFRDTLEDVTTEENGALSDPTSRAHLDTISLESWLGEKVNYNPTACAAAAMVVGALTGVDPGAVSALWFLDYVKTSLGFKTICGDGKGSGQYMRIKEGTSALSEGLFRRLKPDTVHFNSPVQSIVEGPEGDYSIVSTTSGNVFLARRVIISVATPVYRTITFEPPLSPKKKAYVNSTRYNGFVKYIPVFKEPFWRNKGFCGSGNSLVGPFASCMDTSVEDGPTKNWAFTCFIAGQKARAFGALTPAEKQAKIVRQLSDMFNDGEDATPLLETVFESSWDDERYNGWGCPVPTLGPGIYNDCWDAFIAPQGNLHFINNETADVWRGYMDGALRSAERGVKEVVASLKKEEAARPASIVNGI